MMNQLKKKVLWVFMISCFFLMGCESSEDEAMMGKATLKIRLTDAPADYEGVFIDVREIRIKVEFDDDGEDEAHGDDDDDESWITLSNPNPGVYNLLDLTNGLDTLIGEAEIPAGELKQIRLILGNDNTIVEDGNTYDLKTPSAQQSGLKIKVEEELKDGVTYTILLDFDVARSIVEAGNSGNIILKPVIRARIEANSGAIKGVVAPAASSPVIYAILEADTVTSTYANEEGFFMLRALPAGEYKVVVVPVSGYLDKLINDVEVEVGDVEDLGLVGIDVD